MTGPTYLSTDEYNQLVAALLFARPLLAVEPSPFTGAVTADEIKIALGEKANVWPEKIRTMSAEDHDDDMPEIDQAELSDFFEECQAKVERGEPLSMTPAEIDQVADEVEARQKAGTL